MKRIEAVITPFALDVFREAAPRLGIAEFDVVQVYRAGRATAGRRRLYRGCEYGVDLVQSLRLEFVLFDDDVDTTLHDLLELVHLESIVVFTLNQIILPASRRADDPPPLRDDETASTIYCASGSFSEKSGGARTSASEVLIRRVVDGKR